MSKKLAAIGGDKRRSTAAQFFMEDPDHEGEETSDAKSTYDKVVELLNHATLLPKDAQKVNSLKQVQELIVHKEPNLLDNFLDEIVAFQHDKSIDVRKFVLGFIEEACKKDNEILPKVVANVNIMLSDEAVAIQKKVIQCSTQLYKVAMKWLCKAKAITEEMESTWIYVNAIKTRILTMIDSDNDGIRTHALKFSEMIVIVQTYPEPDAVKKNNEVALDEVPLNTKILKIRKLEEEAKKVFDALVVFHGSAHISSVNLMACMGALTNIGKQRPEFMSKVVQALEALHVNLPPTLAKSQVSSVRKQLKVQLLNLLKHPAAGDFHPQITTLLTDLGATQQEIIECLPRLEETKRRSRQDDGGQPSKRLKLEVNEEVDDMDDGDDGDDDKDEDEPAPPEKISKAATNTAIDITAEFLVPRLHSENVSDIVLLSMMMLPDTMPAQFQSSYTPIAAAGTENQIKHLSRLLSTQLTAAGLGPGVEEMAKRAQQELEEKAQEDDGGSSPKHTIETVVGRGTSFRSTKKETPQIVPAGTQAPGKHSKRGGIQLKLSEFTKPMSPAEMKSMQEAALRRILSADKASTVGGAANIRVKILAALATQYSDESSNLLAEFIFEDIRNRSDLAFSWLYEEYAFLQGFSQASYFATKPSVDKYDKVLCCLLKGLLSRPEGNKEKELLFQRLFVESPIITVNAVDILKTFCHDESRANVGMGILKELIIKRPPKQKDFLNVLLELSSFDKPEIRHQALSMLKQLHERGEFRRLIEEYALAYLRFLLVPKPPFVLFGEKKPREVIWSEDLTKLCLYLYLALLPLNHKLIHDLAQVYVSTSANVKRIILRVVEAPVKGMGMSSPELLTLVENCPKGAETLVTRVIHILTDKAPPSSELVARVRDLYHKRVPDVRFLIPVLNGLTKKEVVAALPKLIQLNPVVVKEVFNRLLGGHGETGANYTSPLTPAELLVALHNIDSSKCDMKTIIKATSLCFGEKHIYTQEVLAVVMQQLMEQNPLPTLLMRTVLQSLSLYPRLIGFVMNILQRLILKQVWKQKKVWEGFIKCCQRTKPGSFQVLLQLPAPQLTDVLETSPDLREPLLSHVSNFTEHQRAFIPKAIMSILTGAEYPPGEDGTEHNDLLIDDDDAKGSESADEPAEPAPPGVN